MALIITGLVTLLVAAIVSIDYLRTKCGELETSSRELNEDYSSTANIAGKLEKEVTQLREELKCARHFIGPAIKEDELDKYNEPVVVFNTMSKKPETNQQVFEKYYQERKRNK